MAASREEVFERVKEVLTEQLGIDEERGHRGGVLHGRPRRGLARPRRADHGARGPVRDQDLGRGRAEDHRPSGRPSTTSRRTSSESAGARAADRRAAGRAARAGLPPSIPDRGPRRVVRAARVPRRQRARLRGRARALRPLPRTSPRGSSRRSARTSSRGARARSSPHELGLDRRLEESGEIPDDLRRSSNVLAALMEAVLAALYLERGLDEIAEPVIAAFEPRIEEALTESVDHKTTLQEELAKRGQRVEYVTLTTDGPPHDRTFTCAALVDGEQVGHWHRPDEEGRRAGGCPRGARTARLACRGASAAPASLPLACT